jgi:EAL domain-containing protein (putative c-di-GMP-specific phosphodiesterase class I)
VTTARELDGEAPTPVLTPQPGPWRAAQAAAVAAAEAIAATAAAEVAAEAAVTARAAVDTASAAAIKAVARARDVAAQAVTAASVAAEEVAAAHSASSNLTMPASGSVRMRPPAGVSADARPAVDSGAPGRSVAEVEAWVAAIAAAKVARSVAATAAAAATAAVEAATFVCDQLARDAAATAAAVTIASSCDASPVGSAVASDLLQVRTTRPGEERVLLSSARAAADGRLADELRAGISAGQLRLHYQPVLALASRELVGVESLVRWQHPQRGLLSPAAFIQLAEQTGLIEPLGEWVLHEACRAAVSFEARHGFRLRVGVNVSAVQLSAGDLGATVRQALQIHGCPADRLIIEVTETGMLADMSTAVAALSALRELGASLAIDDFGTGYATLQYLSRLPADALKIDGSFIAAIGRTPKGTALVASLVSLAHNLDVRCVAEGVETEEQAQVLKQVGCDFAQGYLLARPMDEDGLNCWIDGNADALSQSGALPASRFSPERARILAMRGQGMSLSSVAAALNSEGSRTAGERRWSAVSVGRVAQVSVRPRGRPWLKPGGYALTRQ